MTLTRPVPLFVALLLVSAASCSKGGSDAASGATSASAVTSAASTSPSASVSARPARMRRPIRRGGVAGTFLSTASEVTTLTPDQLTKIESLDQQLHASAQLIPVEWRLVHAELVTEARAGVLDPKKLDPLYAGADKAKEARQARDIVALDGLHALLATDTRKAVTDSLRAKQRDRDARAAAAKPEEWRKKQRERLAKEVGLDDAQQKQLETALAKLQPTVAQLDAMKVEHDQRREALLTAFEAETFDAKTAMSAPADAGVAKRPPRESDFVAQVLPILKPDQRERFAGFLSRMGTRGPDAGMFGAELEPGDVFSDSGQMPDRIDSLPTRPMPVPMPVPMPSAAPPSTAPIK
ncbi:MAG: hypothetical protein ACHREM_29530 [Polyangiales bacterium]